MRRPFVAALLSAGLIFAQPATTAAQLVPTSATTPTPDQVKRAYEAFSAAAALIKKSNFAEAEKPLREAWALNPTFDVAINLGQVAWELKKPRDCAELLAYGLRAWPLMEAKKMAKQREPAEKRFAEAKALVGALAVTTNVAGAEIAVDGTLVGRAPLDRDLYLDPGEHVITAALAKYKTGSQKVIATAGKKQEITLTLEDQTGPEPIVPSITPSATAAPTSSSTPPPQIPDEKAGPSPAIYVPGFVLAGGAAVAGGVLVGLAAAKGSDAQKQIDACRSPSAPASILANDCGGAHDTRATQGKFESAALWSFVGALGVGGASLAYYLAVPRTKKAAKQSKAVLLVPYAEKGGGGAFLSGRW